MQMNNFLQQLYQMSSGDVTAEVSMYDVGASLGLDKSDAGAVAEDLIIDGYAELKNLTGGISITTEGLRMLEVDTAGKTDEQSDGSFVLGNAEVLAASKPGLVLINTARGPIIDLDALPQAMRQAGRDRSRRARRRDGELDAAQAELDADVAGGRIRHHLRDRDWFEPLPASLEPLVVVLLELEGAAVARAEDDAGAIGRERFHARIFDGELAAHHRQLARFAPERRLLRLVAPTLAPGPGRGPKRMCRRNCQPQRQRSRQSC